MGWFARKFDGETENLFKEYKYTRFVYPTRIFFLIAIFLYALFGLLDSISAPHSWLANILIRFAFVVPMLFFVLNLSYTSFFRKHMDIVLFGITLFMNAGILGMIAMADPRDISYNTYFPGLMLVSAFGSTMLNISPRSCLAEVSVTIFSYNIICILQKSIPLGENAEKLMNDNFFLMTSATLSLLAAINNDYTIRNAFRDQYHLRNSNEVKDQIFSILGHDLRRPFSSLAGYLSLLQNSQLSKDESINLSKSIHQNFLQVNLLLDNLLKWSMGQKNGIETKLELVNIRNVIDENISLASEPADQKGISIRSDLAELEWVQTDRMMISTLIRNILSNAIKFTPMGGSIMLITSFTVSHFEIEVVDSGVGMTREALDQINRYHGYRSTRGTKGESGAGIGLQICKQFVDKLGGEIAIQSKRSVGTTVKLTFPFTGKKADSSDVQSTASII